VLLTGAAGRDEIPSCVVMGITRRDFLSRASSAPLFFGLPDLLAAATGQAPASAPAKDARASTAAFREALKRMKRTNHFGVAIVIPGSEEHREMLASTLYRLRASTRYEEFELLFEAVFVCVPGSCVDARDGENVVLLDVAGERVAGGEVAYEDVAPFVKGVMSLLRAKGRLDERARLVRTADCDGAIKRFRQDGGAQYLTALELLKSRAWDWGPAIVAARVAEEAERKAISAVGAEPKSELRFALFDAFKKKQTDEARPKPVLVGTDVKWAVEGEDPKLPYGIRWFPQSSGSRCGEPDYPALCGMAGPKNVGQKLFEYLID